MSRKPLARRLRAAYSSTLSNVFSGIVSVPGKRMCADGGSTLPSGTYAITGATSALPSAAAIFPPSTRARTLCLPSTMCGPLCSVPPMGTSAVVLPARTSAASSGDVSSSMKTLSCACAAAANAAMKKASHARAAMALW